MRIPLTSRLILCLGLLIAPLGSTAKAQAPQTTGAAEGSIRIYIESKGTVFIEETITHLDKDTPFSRTLPRRLISEDNNAKDLSYDILSLKRDDIPLSHTILNRADQFSIAPTNAPPAPQPRHKFDLTYAIKNSLITNNYNDFFAWQLTKDSWPVPLQKLSIEIHAPPEAPLAAAHAFTERKAPFPVEKITEDLPARASSENGVAFDLTRPLEKDEVFSIQLSWPQGSIQTTRDFGSFFRTSTFSTLNWANLALILYYVACAFWLRRPRSTRFIIPLFEPPKNLTPAVIAYILEDKNGLQKGFCATLLSLAVKGYMKIAIKKDENGAPQITLQKSETRPSISDTLAPEEQIIYDKLFFASHTTQTLTATDPLGRYLFEKFRLDIVREYSGEYRQPDIVSFMGGVLLSIVGFFVAKHFFVVTHYYYALLIPALYFELMILFCINLAGFFACLRRTQKSAKLLPDIEGFKLYLSIAEKDRLTKLGDPKITPQVFERYLPYAVAMSVVTNWRAHFEAVVEEDDLLHFHPTWYEGDDSFFEDLNDFATTFAQDFGDAILTTSKTYDFTAPFTLLDSGN